MFFPEEVKVFLLLAAVLLLAAFFLVIVFTGAWLRSALSSLGIHEKRAWGALLPHLLWVVPLCLTCVAITLRMVGLW